MPARSLGAAIAVSAAGVLPVFLMGALATFAGAEVGFAETRLGLLTAAAFGAAALTSAWGGRLVQERLGATRGMRLAAGASAVSLGGVALAGSYPVILVCMAVAGLSNAFAQTGANMLLAQGVIPERHGFAFAVKQSAILLAVLVGGASVPLVGSTVGWRWAFAGGAVFAAASMLLVPGGSTAPTARNRAAAPIDRAPVVVLGLAGGLAAAAAGALGTFLVLSAQAVGIDAGTAGVLLASGGVAGLTVRLLSGIHADRALARPNSRYEPLRRVSLLLSLGVVGCVLLSTGLPLAIVTGTLLAFGAGWGWPGLFNFAVVRHHPDAPASATGATQTGVYLGAIFGPLAFGAVAEYVSYAAAWGLAGVVMALGAVCALVGLRFLRRARSAADPVIGPSTVVPSAPDAVVA